MSKIRENGESIPPATLILPDGNRRWAVRNHIPYPEAYEQGARRIVECCRHLGALGRRGTWFGIARPFNFVRAEVEVRAVLDACLEIQSIGRASGEPFNVTVGGDLSLMPSAYAQAFRAQEHDYDSDGVTAHLLIGWSSGTEAVNLVRRARSHPEETAREQLLRSSAVTEPIDFLIRTGIDAPEGSGGRVSGMIPLHSLEAELHFESTLFPDFTTDHLDAALVDYATRTHRDQLSIV